MTDLEPLTAGDGSISLADLVGRMDADGRIRVSPEEAAMLRERGLIKPRPQPPADAFIPDNRHGRRKARRLSR